MSFELYRPECNGICVMAYEILEGASGVAYPHPDCELHSPQPYPEFDEPEYKGTSERHVPYPESCENEVDDPDTGRPAGLCGGFLWDIGGTGYFNGNYQCYTLHLECENCGRYDVECV